jgi:hypothetical protein
MIRNYTKIYALYNFDSTITTAYNLPMFEKPKNFKINVPEEFRQNQIKAVEQGDSWPTPEGAEDDEICKAFEYYLSTASEAELNELSTQLKEVGGKWTTEKLEVISKEEQLVRSKTDPARHIASLAAVITFIPFGLLSALGVKVALNKLISTIEKLALTSTEEKSESWVEIKNHLDQLQYLTEEEISKESDDWNEYKKAA